MKTCLYRFLKECKDCKSDYNLSHHPNNYDCPFHHEINILTFTVIKNPNLEKELCLGQKNTDQKALKK